MLAQRRRRWNNTEPTMAQCLVFADRTHISHIGDGLHMATMHPPPHISTKLSFFGALRYTEHDIEC